MEILLYILYSVLGIIGGIIVIIAGAMGTPGSNTSSSIYTFVIKLVTIIGVGILLFSIYSLVIYGYAGIMLLL